MSDMQKLVDVCFEIGLTISDPKFKFTKMTQEKRAEWIAKQLRLCGFDTEPVGASYGRLKRPVPPLRGRTNIVAMLDDASYLDEKKTNKAGPSSPPIMKRPQPLFVTEGATNPPRSRRMHNA